MTNIYTVISNTIFDFGGRKFKYWCQKKGARVTKNNFLHYVKEELEKINDEIL